MTDKSLQAKILMQEEAKAAVRKSNYNASLIITVGGGKGKVMIDLAEELIKSGKVNSILYVCDNTRLRDSNVEGFPQEIEKWGSEKLKSIIKLECYQTTYKWKKQEYDLLLADEADFAMTSEYVKVFFNNAFKYKILVTGTLAPKKKDLLQSIAPIVYRMSTIDAEKRGIVNKTYYYKYNYKMSDSESRIYQKWTRAVAKAIEAEKPQETVNYLLGQRKELLATLTTSFLSVKRIRKFLAEKKPDARTVIFCERTSQADIVCSHSFHGKNDKENNLKKFQDGEINTISVVSKITRGINLKKANVAIFEMLGSGSTTPFDQRNGRMKRLEIDDVAIVIFLVPWYKKKKLNGEEVYVPTIVDSWIDQATKNLKPSFKTLKL